MRPPISPSPISSRASAEAIVLRCEPSRALERAWLGLHALLAATLVASAAPWWLAASGIVALAAHAVWRRPRTFTGTLVCRADGRFDVPGEGRAGLTLGRCSALGPRWVHLVLEEGDRSFQILISRDQIDDSSWRRFVARLHASG